MRPPFPTLEDAMHQAGAPIPAGLTELTAPVAPPPRTASRPSTQPPFPEYTPQGTQELSVDLEAVRAEAEAIRLQAIQDAERIGEQARREGYQRGYDEGYHDGAREAQQRADAELQQTLETLRAHLQQVIQGVHTQQEAYLQHAESQMLELALEVARKIVREELKLQPAHVLAIVRDALRACKASDACASA
jgi:flagellar biosynthesis/type III secretory pathway protein FliH